MPPLGQDQVDPKRERQLQRLAQIAAPAHRNRSWPLLGNGRAAAGFAEIVASSIGVADQSPVDAVVGAEMRIPPKR